MSAIDSLSESLLSYSDETVGNHTNHPEKDTYCSKIDFSFLKTLLKFWAIQSNVLSTFLSET